MSLYLITMWIFVRKCYHFNGPLDSIRFNSLSPSTQSPPSLTDGFLRCNGRGCAYQFGVIRSRRGWHDRFERSPSFAGHPNATQVGLLRGSSLVRFHVSKHFQDQVWRRKMVQSLRATTFLTCLLLALPSFSLAFFHVLFFTCLLSRLLSV